MRITAASLCLLLFCGIQAQPLPQFRNLTKTYTKGTRSITGKPGPKYWQNSADYVLHTTFSPSTLLVSGTVDIKYFNNSPDTLKEIWFKLYPNLYKKGAPRDRSMDSADVTSGVTIEELAMNKAAVKNYTVDGTNMIIRRTSVAPNQTIDFSIKYHYTLNKKSHIRTGEVEPNAAFVAYFFPRIAVYDDIDGWNKFAYNGQQEFYNDFCNFKAFITVPRNFVVWATGDLQNCNEVLMPMYCGRIQQAEQNDAVTTIIDSTDLKEGRITAANETNTWHFVANNVTDFVFATSDHYIWKSSSVMVDPATKRRTRVDAVFNPKHKDYFEVVNDARKTVEAMSYRFPKWPFPYSHETVFDGLDQMEYPMMVNDNPVEDRAESIELTDHEIFHTMFPFYMGINETKYAWMDEGWATIGEWLITPLIDSTIVDLYGVAPYATSSGTENDPPIMSLSTQLNGNAYFLNSYPKPAFGYLYVKEMLGDELFHKALHNYIRNWNGKHPMPYDFFNSMNEGAGKNLNWFWNKWFFEGGYPDLAITSVKKKGNNYIVLITSKGSKPVPVELVVYTSAGTQSIRKSISVWEKGNKTTTVTFSSANPVTKILLAGSHVPDANKKDNQWLMK